MRHDLICVLDVGKTHAKIALLEPELGAVTWCAEHECKVTVGKCAAIGCGGDEAWLIASLKSAPDKECIRTIVRWRMARRRHCWMAGSSWLAIPDYEDPVFDSVRETYEKLRDPFCATLSPPLPLGLNLGFSSITCRLVTRTFRTRLAICFIRSTGRGGCAVSWRGR